jgi:hypothetical protein
MEHDSVDVSRPSCPNHPISTELGDTEINTQIQGVHANGADQNFGIGRVPLKEVVDRPWVSLLDLTFVCFCQYLFLNAYVFLRKVLGTRATPHRYLT